MHQEQEGEDDAKVEESGVELEEPVLNRQPLHPPQQQTCG